jgi:predicted component of type VI protein secretion system
LHYYPDKDLIWKARNTLKDTNFWLSEDFPVEIAKRRQTLNSIRKKAVEQGSKARLSVNKLFVDGEMFTVDTLNKLPPPSQLSETFTKRTELYTAFYSKHSPLSNFKLAKFTKNGIKFEHYEQYYQYYKAMENQDEEKA